MPKLSVRNRNNKRIKLVEKFRARRDEYRRIVSDPNSGDKERFEAMTSLQKLPRDSAPSRRRKRCNLCSRPRAYNNKTGLCRLHLRLAVIFGMVPGMRKASW